MAQICSFFWKSIFSKASCGSQDFSGIIWKLWNLEEIEFFDFSKFVHNFGKIFFFDTWGEFIL